VSREVAPAQSAVVIVGALQAGTKENVIPDEATIKLNVRTFDEAVRGHVLEAIKRIVEAEAAASGAPRPPEITPLDQYQLVRNDPDAAERVRGAFQAHFGNPRFAPVIHPTLETGVETLTAGACAWLAGP
jgi:hippurate hydrolase